MPYIFSTKQIDYCHHLLIEHNMDFNQVADIMGTSIRDAHHLIRLVWQKYEKPKHDAPKKYCTRAIRFEKKQPAFIRPKAEYSNKRIYDLI